MIFADAKKKKKKTGRVGSLGRGEERGYLTISICKGMGYVMFGLYGRFLYYYFFSFCVEIMCERGGRSPGTIFFNLPYQPRIFPGRAETLISFTITNSTTSQKVKLNP